MRPLVARVVVLAGPSGTGKTRLTARLGLPVLRLDDFYRDGDDPSLPRLDLAGGEPIVDWDDPASWHADLAVAAIEELCRSGAVRVLTYDVAANAATGHHALELGSARLFVAEGIFAQEIVAECRQRGLLADAICLTQQPLLTFFRRLARDLRERRKSPLVLLRRGLHLVGTHRSVVRRAERLGCRVLGPREAYREICGLVGADGSRPSPA